MSGSVLDVQDALIAHVKTIEDPNNAGEFPSAGQTLPTCGFGTVTTPFFWVRRGRLLSRTKLADRTYEYVREYPLLLYVAENCSDNATKNDTNQALAAQWFEPFYDSLRTSMPTPLGANFRIAAATDTGDTDVRTIYNDNWFAGQVFLLQIKTTR